MKTMIRSFIVLAVGASSMVAQNPPPAGQGQPAMPQGQMRQRMPGGGQRQGAPDRTQLEQRVRERIGTALKTNLNLNDEQFTKLQATNKRFEEKRRLLVDQERDARMAMRDLMISGDTGNAKVSQHLDRLIQVQRQRAELMEQEQKDLSGFLTPMQRARYLGMQEQLFRRMEQMRQQRMGGPNGPPQGGMGPGMGQGMKRPMPGMGGDMGPNGPPQGGARGRLRPGQRPPQGEPPVDQP